MKILAFDENRLYLNGVKYTIEESYKECALRCIAKPSLIQNVLIDFKPDILIYTCRYPIEAILNQLKKFKVCLQKLKIIFISNAVSKKLMASIQNDMVDAYIVKQAPTIHLFNSINAVMVGENYVCNDVLKELIAENKHPFAVRYDLNAREIDVLTLIAQELSTKEIAKRLHVSPHTIDTNKRQLMKKFNVRNSIGLVKIALREGLSY